MKRFFKKEIEITPELFQFIVIGFILFAAQVIVWVFFALPISHVANVLFLLLVLVMGLVYGLNEYYEDHVENNSAQIGGPDFKTTIMSPLPWGTTKEKVKEGKIIEASYDIYGLGGKGTKDTKPQEGGEKGVLFVRSDIKLLFGRIFVLCLGRRREVSLADLTIQQRSYLLGTTLDEGVSKRKVQGFPYFEKGKTPIYKIDTLDVEFARTFLMYYTPEIKEFIDKPEEKKPIIANIVIRDRVDLEEYVRHINNKMAHMEVELWEARHSAELGSKIGAYSLASRAPKKGMIRKEVKPDIMPYEVGRQ